MVARKTPPKAKTPATALPPAEQDSPPPSVPDESSLDAALGDLIPPPISSSPTPPSLPAVEANPAGEEEGSGEPPAPEPLIQLGAEAYSDLIPVHGAFSDEPPEGWVEDDPVQHILTPEEEARASLLADAASAPGAQPTHKPLPAQSLGALASREGVGVKSHFVAPPSNAEEVQKALAQGIADGTAQKYRSRLTIGAAYQYDGQLHKAPSWCDRNWAAWEDGPALNIPGVGIVKKGEWVAVQSVLNEDDEVQYSEIKVYPDATFQSLFMLAA